VFILILSLLDTALKLWLSKEKTKYIDKKMELQAAYYAEWNKPLDQRSDAVLDNIMFELKNLAIAFNSAVAKEHLMAEAEQAKGHNED
jgi:hypothetical protein